MEFRIECRRPGAKRWEYVRFTGSMASRIEAARRTVEWLQLDPTHAEWRFRIRQRQVIITHTPWAAVP